MWRAACKIDWGRAYCDTIFAVIDATAVRENMDVGALGTELAVSLWSRAVSVSHVRADWGEGERRIGNQEGLAHLCKVFADGIGGAAEIVTEGTGAAGLAGALAEELARDVACVWEGMVGSAGREQVAAGLGRPSPALGRIGGWAQRTRRTSGAVEAGSSSRRARAVSAPVGGVEAPGPHVTKLGHRCGREGRKKKRGWKGEERRENGVGSEAR